MIDYELTISQDAALDTDPDPAEPCPREADRAVVLPIGEHVVGRLDPAKAPRPAIALRDPGVSRRHVLLILHPDGALALEDLGSANGTRRNGAEVPPNGRIVLMPGDKIELGRWTRIELRRRTARVP